MKKQLITVGIAIVSLLLPLKAVAANFAELYVFGDSLSDTGNTFDFTAGNIPPTPPYFPGRFSNGLIWIDYLAEYLGLNMCQFYMEVIYLHVCSAVHYYHGNYYSNNHND